MRFCNSCNNMLYPVEDKEEHKLKFKCNYCNHYEIVEENNEIQNTVYINEIKLSHVRKAIDPSIVNDPTYSRTTTISCTKCENNEAIYFHDFTQENAGMKLVFVCCGKGCGNTWES